MSSASNRHEGDLGGRLKSFDNTEVMNVAVVVSPTTAHQASAQHTAWMLVNLLVRLDGIVERVDLICPPGVEVVGNIIPLAQSERDLREAILQAASEIGIVPVGSAAVSRADHFVFEVGAGTSLSGVNGAVSGGQRRFHVYGEGWWGGIALEPIRSIEQSDLPFGPYTAACLAVAEVFKAARIVPGSVEPVTSAFYSTWFHRASVTSVPGGPPAVDINLDVALAGVGAVGSTWVHTLWACPGATGHVLLADKDPEGVDSTNLGRYTLFGTSSLGKPKARQAAELCDGGSISWMPYDGALEDLQDIPSRVISAVDRNRARRAIQQRYPARLLSASTLDLRAEVLRCGPPGEGACLSCHNPLEPIVSDDEIRAKLLNGSAADRILLAQQTGVSQDELEGWLRTGRCGQASARLLPFIRRTGKDLPSDFAVSFVSAMAGTLLAAETLKDCFAVDVPLSNMVSRAVLQFWSPVARTNRAGIYLREAACPMCAPDAPATGIWLRRFEALGPHR